MVGDIRLDDRICSCRIFNGPRTVCPKTNSEELNPREAWVVFRTANNKSGICSSHSFSCSTQKVLSIDFNVWWNRSIAPCDWGWYALDTWCLIANCFITFANTLDKISTLVRLNVLRHSKRSAKLNHCFDNCASFNRTQWYCFRKSCRCTH